MDFLNWEWWTWTNLSWDALSEFTLSGFNMSGFNAVFSWDEMGLEENLLVDSKVAKYGSAIRNFRKRQYHIKN